MIRWCSYCQAFLGERAPYDDARMSHGACDACAERLERDDAIVAHTEPVRALMGRITALATEGDGLGCEVLVAEAAAIGLTTRSLLVGLLQPALYQAGLDWQANCMSVAAEHRFTAWCERVLAMLPPPPMHRAAPIDVLLFGAPGNAHTLGPRFAGRLLAERGLAVEVLVPELPLEEMVSLARALRPRCVGFSCALPASVLLANDAAMRMRGRLGPELECRYVLGGFAFRMGGARPALGPDIEVVLDADALRIPDARLGG